MTSRIIAAAIAGLFSASAFAHVSYSTRDFFADGVRTGDTWTLSNQRVTSDFGWADGADADWGDSHRVRWARFTLTETSVVHITVSATTFEYLSGGNTLTALGDLIPGFSLYRGVAPAAAYEAGDHPDYVAHHPGLLPTLSYVATNPSVPLGVREGAFNATGDFWLGNKLSEVGEAGWASVHLAHVGHAVDGAGVDVNGDGVLDLIGDGSANGSVSARFTLDAGSYSVIVGGAYYASPYVDVAAGSGQRGFSAALTVSAVPEPESWALMLAGCGLVGAIARRRMVAR
jgi:hypothetical protein